MPLIGPPQQMADLVGKDVIRVSGASFGAVFRQQVLGHRKQHAVDRESGER
jgi:hypothetical protein